MDLPYSFDRVWDAARTFIEQAQWGVRTAEKGKGCYEVIVTLRPGGWTFFPRIEKLQVNLTRVDENLTKVRAGIRSHQLHRGTSRSYVDAFLVELQKILNLELK